MFEGLAALVLNYYLGNFVENLNTDQLKIALLSGKYDLIYKTVCANFNFKIN